MIRQLVMDPVTKLPLAAPSSGSTGYQISAVVVGLDRPNEILNLRINGCAPHLLICNVSFIVQTRWIKSLQRAISSMAAELEAAQNYSSVRGSLDQTPEDFISSPEHDFGPIGTPIRSPPMRSRQGYFGPATAPLKKSPDRGKDYLGAVGTPVKPSNHERLEYFDSMISPSQGTSGYLRQHSMNEAKLHPKRTFHTDTPDLPNKYTNQAWIRRMLFPDESDGTIQTSLPQGVFKRSWFDRHLNHEQKVQ